MKDKSEGLECWWPSVKPEAIEQADFRTPKGVQYKFKQLLIVVVIFDPLIFFKA